MAEGRERDGGSAASDWTENHKREARARLLELAAKLTREGREHDPDPSCCVVPPLTLRNLLLDGWRGQSSGLFYGVVKTAGFDPELELAEVHKRVTAKVSDRSDTERQDPEVVRLRAALRGILDVCRDRQAFVVHGPRAFAKAEQIAKAALRDTVPVFCPSCGAPRTHDRLDGSVAYYCSCPKYGAGWVSDRSDTSQDFDLTRDLDAFREEMLERVPDEDVRVELDRMFLGLRSSIVASVQAKVISRTVRPEVVLEDR